MNVNCIKKIKKKKPKKNLTVNTDVININEKDYEKNRIKNYLLKKNSRTVVNNVNINLSDENLFNKKTLLSPSSIGNKKNQLSRNNIISPSRYTTELNNNSNQLKKQNNLRLITESNIQKHQKSSYSQSQSKFSPLSPQFMKSISDQSNYLRNINNKFQSIISQMDKSLKTNIDNSKSKKYNIIKKGFESIVKMMPLNITNNYSLNNNLYNALQKFLFGYHDVISDFSKENKELKIKIEKYGNKLIEKNEIINKKEKEISDLKNKLIEYKNLEYKNFENNILDNNTLSEIESPQIQNQICSTEVDTGVLKSDKQIFSLNSKTFKIQNLNTGDLDDFYFFDKVDMQPIKSPNGVGIHLNKLNFDKLNQNSNICINNNIKINKHHNKNFISSNKGSSISFDLIKKKFNKYDS